MNKKTYYVTMKVTEEKLLTFRIGTESLESAIAAAHCLVDNDIDADNYKDYSWNKSLHDIIENQE